MSQTPQVQDEDAADAPPKKSKAKSIVIILALLLLIGGGGFAAYWFLSQGDSSILDSLFSSEPKEKPEPQVMGSPTNETLTPTSKPAVASAGTPTHLVSLPVLTVNLADTGTSRYLRVGIDVEVSTEPASEEIKSQSAKIRDAVIILLSSKRYENISTAGGKFQLKNEIVARINQILGVPRVIQIYFTDFVVQ